MARLQTTDKGKSIEKPLDKLESKVDDINYKLKNQISILNGVYSFKYEININDNVKSMMLKRTIESLERNIEIGFNLYLNEETDILYCDDYCEGSKCDIKMLNPSRNEFIGDFHAHMKSKPDASLGDLYSFYTTGFGCIGGFNDNVPSIKCYGRKTIFDDQIKNELKYISDFYNIKEREFGIEFETHLKNLREVVQNQNLSEHEIDNEIFKLDKSWTELTHRHENYLKCINEKYNYILNKYYNVIEI